MRRNIIFREIKMGLRIWLVTKNNLTKKFMLIPNPIADKTIGIYFPETNILVPINQNAKRLYTLLVQGL